MLFTTLRNPWRQAITQTRRLTTTGAMATVLWSVLLLNGQAPALAQRYFMSGNSTQFHKLSRDLVHLSTQDFFTQGQNKLEGEIRILNENRLFSSPSILKIDQVIKEQGSSLNKQEP